MLPSTPAVSASLADVGEDGLLELMLPILASAGPAPLIGPGDDTAMIRVDSGAVLATADALVEGCDWRDDWSSGIDVGHKAVAQNAADIAAMGGRTTGLLVTLAAADSTPLRWVLEVARGIAAEASALRVTVLGGDLSSTRPGATTIAVTALGELDGGGAAVCRSGARAGDRVWLAGEPGRSAAGLALLRADAADRDVGLVAAHRRPSPPYAEGPRARRLGVHAMIDTSDGLVRDARRIARASRVRIDLHREALRVSAADLSPPLTEAQAWECVLHGGEDHALLAVFPPDCSPPDPWRAVGRVQGEAEEGEVVLDGLPVSVGGWDHFGG